MSIRAETAKPAPEGTGPPVIDRLSGNLFHEKVLGGSLMRLAYGPLRSVTGLFLFRTGLASRLLGVYTRMGMSRRQIEPAVKDLGIDASEFARPISAYRNFHEFFIRKLKPELRPFDPSSGVFSSPADSRLSVYNELSSGLEIPVKGASYTIESLTRRNDLDEFRNGPVMVFRLCPADYHRYHYPAAGYLDDSWEISGAYDSVHPFALKTGIPVFSENHRIVSRLELEVFGSCLFIEVGAFGVGKIVQTHEDSHFSKGDEKGYFCYGASTLVVILRKGYLTIDPDLLENTAKGFETLVRAGEKIGEAP